MPCYDPPPEWEGDAITNAWEAVQLLCAAMSMPEPKLNTLKYAQWYLAHRRIDLRMELASWRPTNPETVATIKADIATLELRVAALEQEKEVPDSDIVDAFAIMDRRITDLYDNGMYSQSNYLAEAKDTLLAVLNSSKRVFDAGEVAVSRAIHNMDLFEKYVGTDDWAKEKLYFDARKIAADLAFAHYRSRNK